jgi:hypothetical protein
MWEPESLAILRASTAGTGKTLIVSQLYSYNFLVGNENLRVMKTHSAEEKPVK